MQGHSRQSWILDSTLWIPDYLSVELGFHIPVVSRILNSLNLIPDSKAQGSGSHDLKFATFQNHGETPRFHLNGNTIGFPQRRNFKFYSVTNYLSMSKNLSRSGRSFSNVALKEHVRGIAGVISVRIRGPFGGISTLITVARFFPPLHTKASVFTFLFTLFRRDFLVTKGSSSRLSAPLRCKIKPY